MHVIESYNGIIVHEYDFTPTEDQLDRAIEWMRTHDIDTSSEIDRTAVMNKKHTHPHKP